MKATKIGVQCVIDELRQIAERVTYLESRYEIDVFDLHLLKRQLEEIKKSSLLA